MLIVETIAITMLVRRVGIKIALMITVILNIYSCQK